MLTILNSRSLVLDLSPGTTIPVTKDSALFNDADKLVQETIYPLKAPHTANNKVFFQNGHRVDANKEVYELEVQVFDDGVHFFDGTATYMSTNAGYEVELKVNIGALATRIKSARLPEIQTMDAVQIPSTFDALDDHMKATAENPERYSYAFFPVHNEIIQNGDAALDYNTVNYWSASQNRFFTRYETSPSPSGFRTAESPFYRLTFILEKVINYMGMQAAGSVFTDPDLTNIYIYTRKAVANLYIQPCFFYMPNITVADFLKQVRERFAMAIDIDVARKTVTCEMFETLKTGAVLDISDYVAEVTELEVPEQKGYIITLKPDSQDKAFDVQVSEDTTEKFPTYTITVGDGDTKVEMNCSTLKFYPLSIVDPSFPGQLGVCWAKQAIMKPGNYRPSRDEVDDAYADFEPKDGNPSARNNWPLRLMRYRGIATDGVATMPISEPVDLTIQDALWYQFLNDAKRVQVLATLPKVVLANMKTTQKLGFYHLGSWCELIIKRIEYDLGKTEDLIPVKIEGQTAQFEKKTPVYIERTDAAPDEYILPRFSAYWDPETYGFSQVDIEIFLPAGGVWRVQPIKQPTDSGGAGGAGGLVIEEVPVPRPPRGTPPGGYIEVRIRQGKPKYLQALGKRFEFEFSAAGNYYYAQIGGLADSCVYWIVF